MRTRLKASAVDVQIGIPPLTITGSLVPSPAERSCAWELLVELASRTSTAPLRKDEGSIREALSSLYTLYETTRQAFKQHGAEIAHDRKGGDLSLGVIGMRVINDIVRPCLSKWHPELTEYEGMRPTTCPEIRWERLWPAGDECRADLTNVRRSIRSYIKTLGDVAGTPGLAEAILPTPTAVPAPRMIPRPGLLTAGMTPRRRMTRWMSLADGLKVAIRSLPWVTRRASLTKAENEVMNPVAAKLDFSRETEFWFDYVADLGDAFDPTMAVAWQLGRDQIELSGDATGEFPPLREEGSRPSAPHTGVLPRGNLLIMGGDEVYPYGEADRYTNQLVGPYKAAANGRPINPENLTPLLAIAGNHDFLGDPNAFVQTFITPTSNSFGLWAPHQDRYWFQVLLPHGWFVWGLTTGLDNRLGAAQEQFFAEAGRALPVDARVIVLTPVPLWQLRVKRPSEYYNIRALLDGWLRAGRAEGESRPTTPLFMSGDSHYFAVYKSVLANVPETHITAGGGGAFLHPTQNLAERVPYERGRSEFELTARWPSPADSRSVLSLGRQLRDRQSLSMIAVFACVHGLFSWLVSWRPGHKSFLNWGAAKPGDWPDPLGYAATATLALVLLVGVAFVVRATVAPNAREHLVEKAAKRFGWLHGLLIAALMWGTTATIAWFVDTRRGAQGSTRLSLLVAGSLVSGLVIYATFLAVTGWLCSRYRLNDNLAFAAAHSERFKHFLRCHISKTGQLTIYAIGLDPVGKGWADALRADPPIAVPPPDPDGVPMLHYIWGCSIPKDAATRSG